MQSSAGGVEFTLAGGEIDGVVRVAPVRRATAREHESSVAKLAEVIGDETLGLIDELGQFRHGPVAADQLAQQSPANVVRSQPHEGGRRIGDREDGPFHGMTLARVSKPNQTGLMYRQVAEDRCRTPAHTAARRFGLRERQDLTVVCTRLRGGSLTAKVTAKESHADGSRRTPANVPAEEMGE